MNSAMISHVVLKVFQNKYTSQTVISLISKLWLACVWFIARPNVTNLLVHKLQGNMFIASSWNVMWSFRCWALKYKVNRLICPITNTQVQSVKSRVHLLWHLRLHYQYQNHQCPPNKGTVDTTSNRIGSGWI